MIRGAVQRMLLVILMVLSLLIPVSCGKKKGSWVERMNVDSSDSTAAEELSILLLLLYWVNSNSCLSEPYLEVTQGDLAGPFTAHQCFHLSTSSAVPITMLTNSTYLGNLTVWLPQREKVMYMDDPAITVPGPNSDVWASAVCWESNCYPYNVQF